MGILVFELIPTRDPRELPCVATWNTWNNSQVQSLCDRALASELVPFEAKGVHAADVLNLLLLALSGGNLGHPRKLSPQVPDIATRVEATRMTFQGQDLEGASLPS